MTATRGRPRAIDENTSIGIGFLVAESQKGTYEPVAAVSSINEAREIAADDLRRRIRRMEQGGDPMCPAQYVAWAQGIEGIYVRVAEIEAR
ncbi:MAG TPA: hypothetical protein VGM43_05115 [Bryobacteraceae bacterium]|jgi:hypothetical protein